MPIKNKRNNSRAVVRSINGKSKKFVAGVLSVAANRSKEVAPIAYSTLVNSQAIDIKSVSGGVKGKLGYYTKYAYYLEFSEWEPRPAPKYGLNTKTGEYGIAKGYNPKARPGFLAYGFTSPASQSEINRLRQTFKVPK